MRSFKVNQPISISAGEQIYIFYSGDKSLRAGGRIAIDVVNIPLIVEADEGNFVTVFLVFVNI